MAALNPSEPNISESEADRRIAQNPRDLGAYVAKADHRLRAGDRKAANAWYGGVVTAVSKGLFLEAEIVTRVEAATTALRAYFTQHTLDWLDRAGFPRSDWHPRFAKAIAIMHGEKARAPDWRRFPQQPNMFFYPDLPYLEFADPSDWSWGSEIEAQTDTIAAEATRLLSTGSFGPYVRRTTERPQGDVHGLVENNDWQTLDLTEMGRPVTERVALAPRSYAAVTAAAPLCDIANRAPSIMFSLLGPGKRIPPHTGMINTRLICHLPIFVPGSGALRVGTQSRQWLEGQMLVFDDTVEHEAWNDAAADRLVLIFDIWRPELELIERAQISALFAAVDAA